jgi:predicted HAD superfamily phosphohydrolase YqeG
MEQPSTLQLGMQELLRAQKLCLVLDLDHTLVNSVKFNEIEREWEFKLEQAAAAQVGHGRD